MTTVRTLYGFICIDCGIKFWTDTGTEDDDKVTCPLCQSPEVESMVGEENHNIQITIKGVEQEKW